MGNQTIENPTRVGHGERIDRLYGRLQDRMNRGQKRWGHDKAAMSEDEAREVSLVLRRAMAVEKTLAIMPITIQEDDLIVGNTTSDGVILRTELLSYFTTKERADAEATGASIGEHLSHKTPYYYGVMEKGLAGIISEIQEKIARAEGSERQDFLEACRRECRAVIALAHRYADLAEQQAGETPDGEWRHQLLTIAEVCRRVPEHAPRTFREALQTFWFVHYALFSTGTKISCGRLDQYLYPCLRGDLQEGRLNLQEAQELVDVLWIRFNDRAQICRDNFFAESDQEVGPDDVVVINRSGSGIAGHRRRPTTAADAADAINHFGQNILLSGIRPDGSDGTNTLTYLCLNAMERLPMTQPVVTVRLHRHSPAEVVQRTAEVLKSGGGMPYINNDEVIIPSYISLGVTPEDARDYANSNCWETMIEGRSDQELIRGINFLLFLELALRRGESPVHGSMGPDTGDPRSFVSFDALMDAWRTQLDYLLGQAMEHIGGGVERGELEHSSHGRYRYNALMSAITLDCLEREQDLIHGGGRYRIWHVMGEAVSNAIDAAAAIKKLVFDEQVVTMDEIITAMEANWEGHENLRRRLMARAPKFANDDDYADQIGQDMMAYFLERVRHHAARYPSTIFPPSVGTFSWYARIGKELGATPDGRRAGEAIAANFSPAPGTDASGPTAAINSHLKMHVGELAAGAPLDLRFSSAGLRGQAGTDRLAGLINTFVDLGGNILTVTVTDVEELRRAMESPEDYRHLRVRMGGWSAYFVMLGHEQQAIHISRVEHGLV